MLNVKTRNLTAFATVPPVCQYPVTSLDVIHSPHRLLTSFAAVEADWRLQQNQHNILLTVYLTDWIRVAKSAFNLPDPLRMRRNFPYVRLKFKHKINIDKIRRILLKFGSHRRQFGLG